MKLNEAPVEILKQSAYIFFDYFCNFFKEQKSMNLPVSGSKLSFECLKV